MTENDFVNDYVEKESRKNFINRKKNQLTGFNSFYPGIALWKMV